MRQERTVQATIFGVFAPRHEIGCELKAISPSGWIEAAPAGGTVWPAICVATGCVARRPDGAGLPAEAVLLLCKCCSKQQLAAVELRRAGVSPRGFGVVSSALPACQLAWSPKKSVLHTRRSARSRPGTTWEAVNHALKWSTPNSKAERAAPRCGSTAHGQPRR